MISLGSLSLFSLHLGEVDWFVVQRKYLVPNKEKDVIWQNCFHFWHLLIWCGLSLSGGWCNEQIQQWSRESPRIQKVNVLKSSWSKLILVNATAIFTILNKMTYQTCCFCCSTDGPAGCPASFSTYTKMLRDYIPINVYKSSNSGEMLIVAVIVSCHDENVYILDGKLVLLE